MAVQCPRCGREVKSAYYLRTAANGERVCAHCEVAESNAMAAPYRWSGSFTVPSG